MNLLIAGSRSFEPKWQDGNLVSGWSQGMMNSVLTDATSALMMEITTVIHGGARGVDQMAGEWAMGLVGGVGLDVRPANWDKYGKRAGYLRNAEMVALADAAIIIWDGKSKGSRHTIRLVHEKAIPYIVIVRNPA